MVSAYELTFYETAGNAVDDVTVDLAVPIDGVALAGKVFILRMDVESMRLLFFGTQFATQIFAIDPHLELIGVGGLVLHAVIDIII